MASVWAEAETLFAVQVKTKLGGVMRRMRFVYVEGVMLCGLGGWLLLEVWMD